MNNLPSIEEFLAFPVEEVRKVVPKTIILTNGGTRRRAILQGISASSDQYADWSRQHMIQCLTLIYEHGVNHIFTTVVGETNFKETTPGYREKLAKWIHWGLAGPEALRDYKQRNWRVRLIGTESWPELQATAEILRSETAQNDGPRLWLLASSSDEHHWESAFSVIRDNPGFTRAQVIRAMYGDDIPLATLYLGSGKPQVSTSNVPLILIGNLQCYWRQHLGYDLDEQTLRKILYDYAYLRKTWEKDKSGRAEQILNYRDVWEKPTVVGLGQRIGPFWYPSES